MKLYGEEDVKIHVFLPLALVGGEWYLHDPAALPRRKSCDGHWIDGCLGPEPVWKILKIVTLLGLKLWPLGLQLVASQYTNEWIEQRDAISLWPTCNSRVCPYAEGTANI
jgi:hypothetical protein